MKGKTGANTSSAPFKALPLGSLLARMAQKLPPKERTKHKRDRRDNRTEISDEILERAERLRVESYKTKSSTKMLKLFCKEHGFALPTLLRRLEMWRASALYLEAKRKLHKGCTL